MEGLIKICLCFTILTLASIIGDSTALTASQEQDILSKFPPPGYDRRVRPTNPQNKSGAVVVKVDMYLRSIEFPNNGKMEYNAQLTFRQQWNDPRLAFTSGQFSGASDYVTLPDTSQIWSPDIFFSNEKSGHLHNLMAPNVYARIFKNGDVLYSSRISLTLACPMNLKKYPFDEQTCPIRMASYGYTIRDVDLQWADKDPVQVKEKLEMTTFSLTNTSTDVCDSTTTTGVYSCLRVDLNLKRFRNYYLLQVYIPTTMMVLVSFTSFWHCKSYTARSIIGIASMLVMGTFISHFNLADNAIPKVSYTKSLDVWTGICMTFVFAAFLEFCTVYYLGQDEEKKDGGGDGGKKWYKQSVKTMWNKSSFTERLDGLSRIVFPIAFFTFMISYWCCR